MAQTTNTMLPSFVAAGVDRVREELRLLRWVGKGRPAPPPHIVKQRAITEYAKKHGLTTLVETGTFRGDMVAAMLHRFDTIYSIELSESLYQSACRRFAGYLHVHLVQGDSGAKLADIVSQLNHPALFWLDGHYSGGDTARGDEDTPIFQELATLLSEQPLRHVILIDDARCFGTEPGYPTLEQVQAFVNRRSPGAGFSVASDSIRITPPA